MKMIREASSFNPGFKEDNCGVVPDGFQVSPIEIDVFYGEFLKWPSFRYVFAAIYISNISLTKVEKLFHLNIKT